MKTTLKAYIKEAVRVEKAGLKVDLKNTSEFKMPDEFKNKLEWMADLKKAFSALTPGRQRGYLLHFSQAKQSKTRAARIEKAVPQILKEKDLMISRATVRSILRWIHVVLAIPILGYIYSSPAEAQQYAFATRFVFVPVLMLAGYWMYAGAVFAIIGVVVWLGAIRLSGVGAAILSQAALFIGRRIWLMIRARPSKQSSCQSHQLTC